MYQPDSLFQIEYNRCNLSAGRCRLAIYTPPFFYKLQKIPRSLDRWRVLLGVEIMINKTPSNNSVDVTTIIRDEGLFSPAYLVK